MYSRLLTIRIYLSIHLLIIKLVMHTLATVMICLAEQNLLCQPCTRIGATEKGKVLWNCFRPHSSLPRAIGLNYKTLMPTSDESNNIPSPPSRDDDTVNSSVPHQGLPPGDSVCCVIIPRTLSALVAVKAHLHPLFEHIIYYSAFDDGRNPSGPSGSVGVPAGAPTGVRPPESEYSILFYCGHCDNVWHGM
jgi:hypothetical protein